MRKACLSRVGIRQLSGSVTCQSVRSACYAKKKKTRHSTLITPPDQDQKTHSPGRPFPNVSCFNEPPATWTMALDHVQMWLPIFPHKITTRLSDNPAGKLSWHSTCSKLAPVSVCVWGWRGLVRHADPNSDTAHVNTDWKAADPEKTTLNRRCCDSTVGLSKSGRSSGHLKVLKCVFAFIGTSCFLWVALSVSLSFIAIYIKGPILCKSHSTPIFNSYVWPSCHWAWPKSEKSIFIWLFHLLPNGWKVIGFSRKQKKHSFCCKQRVKDAVYRRSIQFYE